VGDKLKERVSPFARSGGRRGRHHPAWYNARMTPTRPELLAPAGDPVALRAAVANGADAVYFGLARFNARARAANFTADELPDLMRFLHARNVRGFVALNTLVFADELEDAQRLIVAIAQAGVDAVIVQDLGLVSLTAASPRPCRSTPAPR